MKSFNRRFSFAILAGFCCIVFYLHEALADVKPPSKEKSLPTVSFQDAVSEETMKYLGLSRKKYFSLHDIRGAIIVVEVFSTYCTSCPQNVPILNDLYTAVERDAMLRDKVKIVGIAIGNTVKEAESYKKAYGVLFPVLTDYSFAVHDAMGNPRVPYTVFVRGTAKGKAIADSHHGVLESSEFVLKKVRSLK